MSADARRRVLGALWAWAWRTGVACGTIELLSRALGSENGILSGGGGQSVVIVMAVLVAVAVMGTADAPLRASGLAVERRKLLPRLAGGLLLGIASAGVVLAVLASRGAITGRPRIDLRVVEDLLGAVGGALLIGGAVAFLISGWLYGVLAEAMRARGTIIATAVIGPVLFLLSAPGEIAPDAAWRRGITFALVCAVLGVLRAKSGSIVVSGGVAVGWLIALRLTRKVSGVEMDVDVLAHPVIWIGLGIILLFALVLPGRAEQPESSREVEWFRKSQPLSHLGLFAPIDVWLRIMFRAKTHVGAAYWPRMIGTLAIALINGVLTLPERLATPLLLRNWRPSDPVVIVGVHRSGTTHLQNLLALDPRFACSRTRHVLDPFGFWLSGRIVGPLLNLVLPLQRPMDAVRFSWNTPNEDEYAIANSEHVSPDWGVRFPKEAERYKAYVLPEGFSEAERERWKRRFSWFLGKLTRFNGRVPLVKNPYHTGRASMILEAFPGARFVHIHRDPYDVYRSNLHLANTAHVLFQFQDDDPEQFAERFLAMYASMEDRFYSDAASMSDHQWADVAYEDLDADPVATLRAIYERLQFEWRDEDEQRASAYISSLGTYRKNRHRVVEPALAERIEKAIGHLRVLWNRPLSAPASGRSSSER